MKERETGRRPNIPSLSILESQYKELKEFKDKTGIPINLIVNIAITEFLDGVLARHVDKSSESVKLNFRRRN